MTTTVFQRADGSWAVVIRSTDDGALMTGEWGLPSMDAALAHSHAYVAEQNVLNGRHAHAATWGW